MNVLVDSSVWIDYFRDTGQADTLDLLIGENCVVTNELILSELIPPLNFHRKTEPVSLLRALQQQKIAIDWEEIIHLQTVCLKNGINGVGIPDLIIVQNAIQGGLKILSSDKHFPLIANIVPLEIYS